MKKFLKMDPIIMICVVILLGIGLFTLYSLTLTQIQSQTEFFHKEFISQLIFVFIGAILFGLIFAIPPVYFKFKLVTGSIFLITFLLLLYVALFAPPVKGVRRWINIGSQVTLQPSEFAKITIILTTASLISLQTKLAEETRVRIGKFRAFVIENLYSLSAVFLTLILVGLVIIQPSLSVAVVLVSIAAVIFFANIKQKLLTFIAFISFLLTAVAGQTILFNLQIGYKILLFVIAVAIYGFSIFSKKMNDNIIFASTALGIIVSAFIIPLGWNHILHDFQRDRVTAYLEARQDRRDESAEGFQQEQSKISIGAGQFYGHGFKQISDERLLSLPEPTTDFIFAIFSFKFGFLGSLILISLYLILVLRIFYLADKMNDRFSSLVLIGIGAMILIQFFSNLGMNLDILPVGGTTLPFISAGGSSLLSMIIAIAIAQNIIATNSLEKNNYRKGDNVLIQGWND